MSRVAPIACLGSIGVFWCGTARAQFDPYVVLHVDTSAAALQDACGTLDADDSAECPGADVTCAACPTAGCDNGLADDSRLFSARRAVRKLVENFGEATYALTRFHKDPAPFACKGGGWAGAGAGCGGDAAGVGQNRADVLVGFSPANRDEVLAWVDGCDGWPTATDCDPVADLAPDTGCALCADCGTGCDRELRGSGDAPLAGSLASIRQYLQTVVMPGDPPPGCPRRPYGVFLFTDGANTCAGDAAAEAAALCDLGVAVHVFGFGDPAQQPALDAIAAAGCGPACDTGRCGEPRCDGQTQFVDRESALGVAIGHVLPAEKSQVPGETCVGQELCNGEDDDCDGLSDEDFPGLGDACCNPCAGTLVCDGTEQSLVCDGVGPCFEVCNLRDDDCDGLVDEGAFCCGPEACNGLDDDCDGETDEDFPDLGLACGVDEGACSFGVICCSDGAYACCGADGPYPEVCDCLDNDCNGQTDEVGSRVCYGGPTDECPDPESGECVGICRPGIQHCTTAACPATPAFGTCIGWIGPRTEECNCLDDDCDGLTDDGATCADGSPCVGCSCAFPCGGEFPCPAGHFCTASCGDKPPGWCVPDPCAGRVCARGEVCDSCTDRCERICDVIDCGEGACCEDRCCETWQSCRDTDGDGARSCDDTSCSNPDSPCPDGTVCVDHNCVADPCAAVTCSSGEFCLDGTCRPLCPRCAAGETCIGGQCVVPCANACREDQVCCGARCVSDPCRVVACEAGDVCDGCEGICVDDPCLRAHCPSGTRCALGECVPAASLDLAVGGGACDCDVGRVLDPGSGAALLLLLAGLGARDSRRRARRSPTPVS